jgi:hypothetical protein
MEDETGGASSMQGGDEKYILNFSRKSERKWPLGRHRRRCVDGIRRDLKGIVYEVADWTYLAQDKVQWYVCLGSHSGEY